MRTAPAPRFEVTDLGPAGLLAEAADNERAIRQGEVRRLDLAYEWAVRHPATTETGVATPGGPALDVLDTPESLGGEGTPAVAAFSPEPFAAALGLSPAAGARLLGDALDLHHRLPTLWARVRRLEVPAWQARRVAQQTRRLPLAGARRVDDQLATRPGGGCGPAIVDRLVARASAEFDPQTQADREDAAETGWDLELSHPHPADFVGTSHLAATGDTATLTEFHDLVCALAHQLYADGDTSPPGVRKIKALRLITRAARGHGSVTTGPDPTPTSGNSSCSGADKIKVYVHVDAADLDVDATGGSALVTAEVERLGTVTLTKLRHWAGHHRVVIQPVLNLRRGDSVDVHDPPAWMRELVILRDRHCVFPGCTRPARSCDLDHTIPFDPDGPPGQTHPANLACLCRRHHRAKTAGVWRYLRTTDGDYLWHGPYGSAYLVTPRGTHKVR
jgi:hypothetical protein